MTATVQQDGLRRVLGTRDLVVYYLSSLVGAGMLIAPGIAMQAAGPASLVAWVLLTLAALPIAGVFARLSAAYPDSAGVSYLVRRAFGWRPGITIGFLLLVLNWTTNPILGLAAARYLAALMGWQDYSAMLLAAFAVMSIGVVLNLLGIGVASRVQGALVVVLIAGVVAVMAVASPAADVDRLTPFAPYGWGAIGAAVLAGFFAFFGWENVSHIADEVRDPKRSYPRAAVWAPLVIGGLYLTLALTLVLVVPLTAATDKTAVLYAVLWHSHGETAAKVGSALAVVLLIVTTNAWVCGCSRLTYAMARDRVIPAWIGRVSPRTGAPVAALWFVWGWYVLDFAVLAAFGEDEQILVGFVAASILLVYAAAFLAAFRLFSDLPTRMLCVVALVAVSAFLLGGGMSTVLATAGLAITAGYVLLRRPAEPQADPAPGEEST
ncbi:MAG: APC family permease [Micromonosporaceae bacterium]